MKRLTALCLIAVGLAATIAWEVTGMPRLGVTPIREGAVTVASASPAEDAELTRDWASKALMRPLFSPDRRPAAEDATAGAGLSGLPRLTGIMVGPFGRTAIFAVDSQKPIVVREGARINVYTVRAIDAAQVSVVGPDGVRVLYPAFAAAVAK